MMKRRAFGMLLSLCLALMLIPAAASADADITLTVRCTINVVKGGSEDPGETKFLLEAMDYDGESPSIDGVTIVCPTVTTDGEGSYSGEVTFTGAPEDLQKLSDGIFVRQQNLGEPGWTYDPAVWCVQVKPVASRAAQDDTLPSLAYVVYPTVYDAESDMYIWQDEPQSTMTFTNIYTKSAAEETPKPEETPNPGGTTDPNDATPVPDTTNLPKTGDSSRLTGWLALLGACCAGLWCVSRRRG